MNRSTFDIIKDLLRKHLQQDLLPDEQRQLDAWVNESPENQRFFEQLSGAESFEQAFRRFVHSREKILSALYQQIPELQDSRRQERTPVPARRVLLPGRRSWAAAACTLLVLGAGMYYWTSHKTKQPSSALVMHPIDIAPGRTGAILTLADGSEVVLDSLGNQVIATQNGTKVVMLQGGLTYDPTGAADGRVVYNTMTTPKGRQFQVTLPDGTRVWLNAASSITYPTAFRGKERPVTVTGEVYFEVAKNAGMPFLVNVAGKEAIAVLGTSFNVNAYTDEATINTTLLEGSVKVIQTPEVKGTTPGSNATVVLKPGQQAQMASARIKVIENANLDQVVAWKSGVFNFEDTRLEEVMRQLERWYDIDVIYEHGIPDIEFGGKITKGVSLNGLLVLLKRADVHFRQEGRKLIITQ